MIRRRIRLVQGLTLLSTGALAGAFGYGAANLVPTLTRGTSRWLAGGAGLLAVASFLITRLGNVPINGRIKQWAATSAPADHAEILARWEAFNYARTAAAFAAFALLILLSLGGKMLAAEEVTG
ncbi:anthrone oxygenase family protein [Streptomyces lasiicapitis]|uniref:anthrone oxygenase family protein n=1 Tax=Streptomyces lasiicapitis TaxID=1923961 RepID=UPI00364A92B4